jgi:hypothetical protein
VPWTYVVLPAPPVCYWQDLSFQDPDSLLYEELDITGDEDQLDDWAQGSWVGAGGRRR